MKSKSQAASCRHLVRSHLTTLTGCCLLLLPMALPTSALAVSYSQGVVTSVSDILNVGTPVLAVNLGNSAPAVTVNGVSFSAVTGAGLTGFVVSGPADFSTQFTTGGVLDQLFSGLYFQNFNTYNASLTLSGLTAGQDYLLQLFVCNQENTTGKSSRVTVQGADYNLANFGNDADYIRAYFTASASTEIIGFGKNSEFEPDRMVLNSYALTAIPEPSTYGLMGLGMAALAWVRRARR